VQKFLSYLVLCALQLFTLNNIAGQEIPQSVKSLLPKEFSAPLTGIDELIVGISNPGRDSVTGFREALLRAHLIASLRDRVKVNMVCEYFSSTKGNDAARISRFEEMYNIESNLAEGVSLVPVWSYILSSGETLLFARLESGSSKGCTYKFESSLYHVENILERGQHIYKTNFRFYPSGGGSGEERTEIYSFNNLWYTVVTCINGKESEKRNLKYFYHPLRDSNTEEGAPEGSTGVSTSEGLWPAYIAAILWQIAGVFDYGNPSVSQVTDSYSKNIRNLNRSAECNSVNAQIVRLVLFKDRLYPIVKIQQLNTGEK